MRKRLLGIGLLGILAGGTWWLIKQARLIFDYDISIINYRIQRLTLSQVIISFLLEVKNKAEIDIIIRGYDIDISLDTVLVSKLKYNVPQLIPSESTGDLTLLVNFDPRRLGEQAATSGLLENLLKMPNDVLLSAIGTVTIENPRTRTIKRIPIELGYTLGELKPEA